MRKDNNKLHKAVHDYSQIEGYERKICRERGSLESEIKRASSWLRKRNYQLYLKSEEWKRRRELILFRDDFKCVLCNELAEHVHHLTYDRIYNEPDYDLISLCSDCHKALHTLDRD